MKKIIFVLMAVFFVASMAHAACTMTPGTRIESSGKYGSVITIPLVVTCDASGGAVTATDIPDTAVSGSQLIEVEIVPGATCDAASVSIRNSRIGPDSLGGLKWYKDAIDTTQTRTYGGHETTGIFPLMDDKWRFSCSDPGANGSFTAYLKMSR